MAQTRPHGHNCACMFMGPNFNTARVRKLAPESRILQKCLNRQLTKMFWRSVPQLHDIPMLRLKGGDPKMGEFGQGKSGRSVTKGRQTSRVRATAPCAHITIGPLNRTTHVSIKFVWGLVHEKMVNIY